MELTLDDLVQVKVERICETPDCLEIATHGVTVPDLLGKDKPLVLNYCHACWRRFMLATNQAALSSV